MFRMVVCMYLTAMFLRAESTLILLTPNEAEVWGSDAHGCTQHAEGTQLQVS